MGATALSGAAGVEGPQGGEKTGRGLGEVAGLRQVEVAGNGAKAQQDFTGLCHFSAQSHGRIRRVMAFHHARGEQGLAIAGIGQPAGNGLDLAPGQPARPQQGRRAAQEGDDG